MITQIWKLCSLLGSIVGKREQRQTNLESVCRAFFGCQTDSIQWAIPKTKDLILLVAFNQFSCKCNFCFQKSRSLDHRRTKRIRPNSLSITEAVQIKKRPKSVGPTPFREFSHLFHKPSTPQEINKTFEDDSYLGYKVLPSFDIWLEASTFEKLLFCVNNSFCFCGEKKIVHLLRNLLLISKVISFILSNQCQRVLIIRSSIRN